MLKRRVILPTERDIKALDKARCEVVDRLQYQVDFFQNGYFLCRRVRNLPSMRYMQEQLMHVFEKRQKALDSISIVTFTKTARKRVIKCR